MKKQSPLYDDPKITSYHKRAFVVAIVGAGVIAASLVLLAVVSYLSIKNNWQ